MDEVTRPAVRLAIIAARFNGDVVDRLIATAIDELARNGITADDIPVHRVPGAFELPVAAQAVLRSADPPDAVICFGAVIRGETPHFDFVAGAAAEGILRVGLDAGRPVIFGVLTTNTLEQAWDRADGTYRRGEDAARDALEMVRLLRSLPSQRPTTGGPELPPPPSRRPSGPRQARS
jgi:6,7-dimethyl-8-ribityllumazine synthase